MTYNSNNYTRCEKCKHIDRENEKCKITNDNWLVSDRAGTCHQFEGVESMKVRCVDNRNYERVLKINDIYDVVSENKEHYELLIGFIPAFFKKSRFEVVKDKNEKQVKEFEEQMEKVGKMFCNPIKPTHYQAGEFDVIDFCFKYNLDFASGNVVKYIVRAGKKDKNKELEDLLKAKEYLERKIERVKTNDNN